MVFIDMNEDSPLVGDLQKNQNKFLVFKSLNDSMILVAER